MSVRTVTPFEIQLSSPASDLHPNLRAESGQRKMGRKRWRPSTWQLFHSMTNRAGIQLKQESDTDGILNEIADISMGSFGSLCISHKYRLVPVPLHVYNDVFDAVRQKTDMVSGILNEIGQLDNKGFLSFISNCYQSAS